MPAPYRSYGSYKMIPNVQKLSVDSISANFTSGDLTRWLKSYHFEVPIPINVVPIPLNVVQHGIDDGWRSDFGYRVHPLPKTCFG